MYKYLFVIFIAMIGSCSFDNDKPEIKASKNIDNYGFCTDSLEVFDGIVEKNQTITDILLQHNVDQNRINEIVKLSKTKFDLTRIRTNNSYKIYSEIDSTEVIKYMIYEIDPINYVVVDFSDSLRIYDLKKDIKVREKIATGKINYSLFTTLQNKEIPVALVFSLADVYAWQIDFYRIAKNDSFKVVYEEKFVDDKSIGIGKIKSAYFNHAGKEYYAFLYNQDGETGYFDQFGLSLKKQFLKTPLKFTRISSKFTFSRFHPVLRKSMPHTGIDYAAPNGTPVKAIGDGIVTFAQYSGAAGKYIKIKHNSTYGSGYMHLSNFGKGIRPGARVRQGDIIGYVGSTGRSTGPHLDFRFWINEKPFNYLQMEFPPIKPINQKNQKHFASIKNVWIEFLKKIHVIEENPSPVLVSP